MSEIDHWFRFNIGDYLADTMHFSTMQHGIYVKLLLHAYRHGGIIPDDERELAQIAGTSALIWRANNGPVVGCFARVTGGYQHKRVLQELERAKVASSMGKHAAAHRWPKGNGDADRIPDGTPVRYANHVRNANQEPEPESKNPPRSPPAGGARGRGNFAAPGGAPPRNAFVSVARDMMEDRHGPRGVQAETASTRHRSLEHDESDP